MALKMNANLKLDTNSVQSKRYLADPERLKKDLEKERRITRLKQVRVRSNDIAREVRQNVAAEQTHLMKKFEEAKQQELDTWREHVLAKKHQDYRSSMFQVGAAHRAARVETEKTAQQKQLRAEKIKNCRNLAAKRSSTVPTLRSTDSNTLNVEGRATAGTQTPVQLTNEGKENRLCNKQDCKVLNMPVASKRKRRTCCRTSANCQCESSDEEVMYSDSSLDGTAEQPTTASSNGKLQKTPPIILDVDIESEDSLESCSVNGIEINDRHMQTNRKFSRVVRPTAGESPKAQPTAAARPRFTQISDLVRRNVQIREPTAGNSHEQPQERPNASPTRSLPRTPTKTTSEMQANLFHETTSKATVSSPAGSRRLSQSEKRSSLKSSTKQPAPAKVINAGLRRTAPSAQTKATENTNATKSKQQQPPIQQSRMQQQPVQQQPVQLQPFQPQPMQQQSMQYAMPMQQQPMQPMSMPQQFQSYVPTHIYPHAAVYPPQPMPPIAMIPYVMPPYQMPTMNTELPTQQAVSTSTTTSALSTSAPSRTTTAGPSRMTTAASSRMTTAAPSRTTATHSTVSATTYVLRQGVNSNSAAQVEFYDHNNKYRRNYRAPEKAVQVNTRETSELNAMDHARIETQLRQVREQELDNLRKVTDKRGEKALQREQVRRDCAELTEKLDALTQQQPQLLPNDADFIPSHRFEDLASKREQKINEAMEHMLLRPAIVTCAEVGASKRQSPRKQTKSRAKESINLGDPPGDKADDAVSSTSCCSMLLDFVDDQSKQLRHELRGTQGNSDKSKKLKALLQRIEKIREHLLRELEAGDMNVDNAQKVIDSIRQERANLNSNTARKLDEREVELERKEALLEQRCRQLYRKENKIFDGQTERRKHDDKPVEIIIKVKSDGTVKQYIPKNRAQSKQTIATVPVQDKPTVATLNTATSTQGLIQRQLSIDSTSTVYRDLPPVNYKNVNGEAAAKTAEPTQREPLNPIIGQYIQRLLEMSPSALNQLGISSSDVPTPTASIINQSRNVSSGSTVDETLIDNQHVERMQAFIQENRSFVNELEDTLRNKQKEQEQQQQAQVELPPPQEPDNESSNRVTQKPWKNRLTSKNLQQQQQQQRNHAPEPVPQTETERPTTSRKASSARRSTLPDMESAKTTARSLISKVQPSPLTVTEAPTSTRGTEPQTQRTFEKPTSSGHSSKVITTSDEAVAVRIERVTENCMQRISDLTALILKVRKEKQRLVEVTLTSASDGERQSTEYFDLPPLEYPARSRTVSDRSDAQNTTPSHSEALPLQRNKATGGSLDSGIAISRPLTAMGLELADAEPTSLPLSSQRRGKVPPATIRRYSPQLAADELAHELSTITEVDTPGQSHVLAAAPAPTAFPTFEQYAREMNLDLAVINPDQSIRLQHNYLQLMEAIRQHASPVNYREFPSISAYLHDITATMTRVQFETQLEQPSAAAAAADVFQPLRLPNVSIREFPNRHEYIEQLVAREPLEQREMLDTASLELDSSDSFNVEEELRQRRILKTSFRRYPDADQDVASSTRRESVPPNASTNVPNESGIDPLTRSQVGWEKQYDVESVSVRSRLDKHRQRKQIETSARGGTSPEPRQNNRSTGGSEYHNSQGYAVDTPQDASQMGRHVSLRDFLTQELLRHRHHSVDSSSESTEESIKGNFLQTVLDSLSVSSSQNSPALGHGTNATNDRQKTSTPVGSFTTGKERSQSAETIDSQLFSVESRISAVNYADGTPPVPYEEQLQSTRKTATLPYRSSKTPNRKTPK